MDTREDERMMPPPPPENNVKEMIQEEDEDMDEEEEIDSKEDLLASIQGQQRQRATKNFKSESGESKLKRSKKCLTLQDKVEIIERSKYPGFSQQDMVRVYGVSPSCISGILKNERRILTAFDHSGDSKKKRVSSGRFSDLEANLYHWIVEQQAYGFKLTGPIIIAKAKEMAEILPSTSDQPANGLTFSRGWLDKFKKRYNLKFKVSPGEELVKASYRASQGGNSSGTSASKEMSVEDWVSDTWPHLLSQYDPSCIYNGGEAMLCYKGLSGSGYVPGNVIPKAARERLTVLLTTNMDGSDKKRLMVVGKAARPRGFPRNLGSLPVEYEFADKAKMNSEIFIKFLKRWDWELKLMGKRIVYIVDVSPCHPDIGRELSQIRLEFLPKNATALIQVANAGIIRYLKAYYRSSLCMRLLQNGFKEDPNTSPFGQIRVLDAIYLVSEAWKKVQPCLIQNCYAKAFIFGFDNDSMDLLQDIPIPPGMHQEEFLKEITSAEEMEEELERSADQDESGRVKQEPLKAEEGDDDENYDDDAEMEKAVKPAECLQALSVVRSYCQKHGLNTPTGELHTVLQFIEKECLTAELEGKDKEEHSTFQDSYNKFIK